MSDFTEGLRASAQNIDDGLDRKNKPCHTSMMLRDAADRIDDLEQTVVRCNDILGVVDRAFAKLDEAAKLIEAARGSELTIEDDAKIRAAVLACRKSERTVKT